MSLLVICMTSRVIMHDLQAERYIGTEKKELQGAYQPLHPLVVWKLQGCKTCTMVIGMGNAKCNSHTNQYGTRYAGDAMRYGTGLAWHATCRRGTIRVYGLGAPLVYGVLVRTSFFPP